jgi:hypothetical protein
MNGLDRLVHEMVELTLVVASGRLRVRLPGQQGSRE